jgi:hypothetical protein
MYRPTYFALHELVPRAELDRYGERLWNVYDDRILRAADKLRDKFGPMVVNDWFYGGTNQYRGFRPAGCDVGAKLSQHRYGRALDLIPMRAPAETIRQAIIEDLEMVRDDDGTFLVTAMEADVSWLHIDCRNHDVARYGIKLFAA